MKRHLYEDQTTQDHHPEAMSYLSRKTQKLFAKKESEEFERESKREKVKKG